MQMSMAGGNWHAQLYYTENNFHKVCDDKWHHLAVVVRRSQKKVFMYVDGKDIITSMGRREFKGRIMTFCPRCPLV